MSATTSKPPNGFTPNGRTPVPTTPSRSPSRLVKEGSPAPTTTPNGMTRTRSVRSTAPVSARGAVRKPVTPEDVAEKDAKAEAQARLEELQERLRQAELAYEESQKQAAVLQVKLDEARKEQGMLEESVQEHTERIEDLENEKKESLRARREMEQIYESDRAATMKEKEEAVSREEELQHAMQRMKESLAQREMLRAGLDDERKPNLSRQSSFGTRSAAASPGTEGDLQFAPSSVQRSDSTSRSNSKLVLQKDKLIESLRLELAEAQIKLVEVENMGGGRMQELQRQMYDIKMQNGRLMEENESFQLLLSEKTLNGDFLRPPTHVASRPASRSPDNRRPDRRGSGMGASGTSTGGQSLADELDSHSDGEGSEEQRRLHTEVNSLKDQNKALTLYINNIISRLLQHEQFEQILDKTPDLMAGPNAASRRYFESREKDLPPPPPEKDDDQSTGLLQRAKSVMGGPSSRPRPRPLSQQSLQAHDPNLPQPMVSPLRFDNDNNHHSTLHENPQTAPSVPLGRSKSTRLPHGHRRTHSEWPAASLVTNMYRGPHPSMTPLSPGLTSPSTRTSFFATPTSRVVSTSSTVPTISETDVSQLRDKENSSPPTQRDSKFSSLGTSSFPVPASHSNRNSTISNATNPALFDSSIDDSTPASSFTNPSSPPRSITSSSETGTNNPKSSNSSGAIMMGSRMRPLRLVQEAADQDEAAKKAAAPPAGAGNRSSWFGWMGQRPGTSGPTTTSPNPAAGGNLSVAAAASQNVPAGGVPLGTGFTALTRSFTSEAGNRDSTISSASAPTQAQ